MCNTVLLHYHAPVTSRLRGVKMQIKYVSIFQTSTCKDLLSRAFVVICFFSLLFFLNEPEIGQYVKKLFEERKGKQDHSVIYLVCLT